MKVLIVDYGMCNLGSVLRAFEECQSAPFVSTNPQDIDKASAIVIPGVGSFGDAMDNLNRWGWPDAIRSAASRQIPILGICLGMQLLATRSFENGEHAGLDLIKGDVIRLNPNNISERVPHVGWNEVRAIGEQPLFRAIENGTDFYFVHSFFFSVADMNCKCAETPYAGVFTSGVKSGSIYGVQFHPEKSGRPGFQLIRNFLQLSVGLLC